MRILITGATGFVGSALAGRLKSAGHGILTVSRRPGADFDWSEDSLRRGVEQADAIVHLAGENLFGRRWGAKQKEVLRRSRIDSTRRLAELAARLKPAVLLSASAIGYVGPSESRGIDESSAQGTDFLAQLCGDWEAATLPARRAGVRTCQVRIGVVLGAGGGALAKMLLPFRLGLGAPLGSGTQWVSWIHLQDLCALFQFLIENGQCSGPYDGTAPEPVTMTQLSKSLGRALRRPVFMPKVPGFALRLALGNVADVLLEGQHVLPRRALEAGFKFQYPEVDAALSEIFGRAPSMTACGDTRR